MSDFPAHIRIENDGTEVVQTVTEHNCAVAGLCSESLKPLGFADSGRLLGLIHDMGKYTSAFSSYITKAARKEKVVVGSVNHTFAAVRFLWESYGDLDNYSRAACEILSFAAGSHHGQFDCISPEGKDGFKHRIEKQDIFYDEAKSNFLAECATREEIDTLFKGSVCEIKEFIRSCFNCADYKDVRERYFAFSMLSRLLLSALIDADRRDTSDFMRCGYKKEPHETDKDIWTDPFNRASEKVSGLPKGTPVNMARGVFSDECRKFKYESSGIYRLSLPTGGGKTLASLLSALSIAQKHKKDRIVFVTPLLSVLEQNSKIIHEYIGDDSLICEHHSNVIHKEGEEGELNGNELLSVSWEAPIIITTLVQFLDMLFKGRTSCIRRMSSIINSVIVFDEIQSLPRNLITCFNLAVNYLTRFCGVCVILCSATQPCFEHAEHPLYMPESIVPYDKELWQPFKRTQLTVPDKPGGFDPQELAQMVCEQLALQGSVLLICNKKAQAREMFGLLRAHAVKTFHLSTGMCMAHRIKTLEEINRSLGAREPVICVSTQLVEAGIDFSFGCVIRIFAGLDNAVQCAGRCNRSGEYGEIRPVFMVRLKGETLNYLPDIRAAQTAMQNVLYSRVEDLLSDSAIEKYYRTLYGNMKTGGQDYVCPKLDTTLFDMLSINEDFAVKSDGDSEHLLNQAFKTAGEVFKVFDDVATDVLVPYGEGAGLIADLSSERAEHDIAYRKQCVDLSGKFSVSLFEYQIKELQKAGGISAVCDGSVLALQPGFYSDEIGINMEGDNNTLLEV